MTVLRVTVPDQYFCTKHPDLNITAQEKKVEQGQVSLLMEKYSPLFFCDSKGLIWKNTCHIQHISLLPFSEMSGGERKVSCLECQCSEVQPVHCSLIQSSVLQDEANNFQNLACSQFLRTKRYLDDHTEILTETCSCATVVFRLKFNL